MAVCQINHIRSAQNNEESSMFQLNKSVSKDMYRYMSSYSIALGASETANRFGIRISDLDGCVEDHFSDHREVHLERSHKIQLSKPINRLRGVFNGNYLS